MIARGDRHPERADVWAALAAPIDPAAVEWRQDGKVIQRDGKYFARFVAYIDAQTARERFDAVVPGEWDLTLELLPPVTTADGDGVDTSGCAFKARLQVLGCIREDVGTGRDYKSAATDAFKRAAVRFGVAHELYAYRPNWVPMDGDGRNARPLEDPGVVYARRYGPKGQTGNGGESRAEGQVGHREQENGREQTPTHVGGAQSPSPRGAADTPAPACPVCGGDMWDNRQSKRNPKAPDFKCRDKGCEGVIWPPRPAKNGKAKQPVSLGPHVPGLDDDTCPPDHDDSDIPF